MIRDLQTMSIIKLRLLHVFLMQAAMLSGCDGYADTTANRTASSRLQINPNPSLFSIPKTIDIITWKLTELDAELDTLPQLSDPLQIKAYGYHSPHWRVLDDLPDQPRWRLEFVFDEQAPPDQLIIVPAIDRHFDRMRSYGFPKRFRILQLDTNNIPRLAKEWMAEDYPTPGRTPIVIDLPKPYSSRIVLQVFRGDRIRDAELIALDEVFGVSKREIQRVVDIKSGQQFTSPPYWGKQFVIDQQTSLGLPVASLPGTKSTGTDFIALFENIPDVEGTIELDLGQNRPIGWVSIFPAIPPGHMVLPGFGFPNKVNISIIPETEPGKRGEPINQPDWQLAGNPGNNIVRVNGHNNKGRWIRFNCSELPWHNEKRVCAFGEIHVYKGSTSYKVKKVSLIDFPEHAEETAGLLVDMKSNGRPIMRLYDWLCALELRNRLETNRSELTGIRSKLEKRWKGFWINSAITSVGIVMMLALGTSAYQIVARRRHAAQLRSQVTSDLHDDIGSNLAALGLAATNLEQHSIDPLVLEESHRMKKVVEDTHQGLRDVLWLTDTNTESLKQLIQKLSETARKVVSGKRLTLNTPPLNSIQARPVGIRIRRDLLLLFKEALHNAMDHSAATEIEVTIAFHGKNLQLTVRDNGKGFEPKTDSGHNERMQRGLLTMYARSHRLKGKLDIQSSPGAGTTIRLVVKI